MEHVLLGLIIICCLGLIYSSIRQFLEIRRIYKRRAEVKELLEFLRKDEAK